MMRFLALTLATALMAIPAAAGAAERKTPEQKLAHALEGRVAGAPVDCIQMREIRSSRIFDRTAILYEMNNGTFYLNRPKAGASSLRWSQILVTKTHGSQLCSIDVIRLVDSASQVQMGFVGLDKFIPYSKPKK